MLDDRFVDCDPSGDERLDGQRRVGRESRFGEGSRFVRFDPREFPLQSFASHDGAAAFAVAQ